MAEKENKNISESSLIGLIRKLEKSANMGFWEKNLLTGDYYWSDQFFEIFGLDPEKDLPSESLRLSCIHPEDREKSKKAYQNAIEAGQSFKIEKRIIRPDGEIRHIVSESHIEKNEKGLPIKVYGIVKDISTEKLLQKKAERKKRELQSFFKNSKDLLIEINWDGIIQNISESSYQNLGYHPDELIGKYLKDLVFPEDLPETMQAARKVRAGEIVSNFKNRYIHKNGGLVNLEWSITTDPEYQALFISARNINEKIELEKETKGLLERLNRAQKIAKLGYWELEVKSEKLFWSDEIYRIWELSTDFEPDFNFFKNSIHPDDRDEFLEALEQTLSESGSMDCVHRIIMEDGRVKYVRERASPYINPDSGHRVLRGTAQDITEEKLIENELKSRNNFIESALENLSIGVAVNEISSGKATFMNNAFSEIYGWPKSTIKDVESFFKSAYPDPEYRAKISQQIMSDMQSGDPSRMQWQDIFITTQDGKQRVVSAKNIPILDQDLMISTVWDETDRYWAEQTLKKSNERFHLATEAITDAIFDWNILGKKIFWGKGYHHLFGYPEEMQYVPEGFWESCVHPDDLPQILEDIQRARKDPNAKKWKGSYRFKKADGSYAFVKEQTSIQRDKSGKPIRIVGALQDITKEKEREASIAQKTLFIQKSAECAQIFLSADNWETIMDDVLRIMGETIHADRAYLFRKIEDKNGRDYVRFDYEWTNGKVKEEIQNPKYHTIPIDEHPLLIQDASVKKPFTVLLSDASGHTRQIMEAQKILSMLNGSLYVNGGYFGHVGFECCFEEREWTDEEKNFIQSIINNLIVAIEKQETMNQLAEALENNSNILESIGEAFYSLDDKYRFTYWNYQAEQLTGLKREVVLNKTIWEVFEEAIHPDFAKLLKYAMSSKSQQELEIEDPFTKSWLEISVYPRAVGLSIFVRNITDRKKAEEEIAEFNERFTIISNTSHDAIWDWNIKTGEHYWGIGFNKLLGQDVAGLQDNHNRWLESIHPEDVISVKETLKKVLQDPEKTIFESEYRIINQNKTFYVVDRGTIIRDSKGKAVRMVGAIQDISHRKRYEESLKALNQQLMVSNRELENSNRELEQFAYVASHDLQEPLRMISSFLGLIEKKYDDILDEKGKQYISFAVDGAKRMRSIILDLLDFSRLKEATESKMWIQMPQIIKEVLLLNKKLISESGAKIKINSLPSVFAQESGLIQLFNNLISNSIKYKKDGVKPIIDISAEEEENYWHFKLKDNGIGIDPKYLDKIFIIFQRLHGREHYPGSGIGLSICKKITEIHGGKIWVESTLGEGSTFHFTLQKPQNE